MLLEHENWHLGYDQILKDCRRDKDNNNGSRTTLILCNADVDAMSSARILSYMLRSDGVHYQLLPCTCYSDLQRQLTNMVKEGSIEDVCSIVLLNFGARYNLTRLFGNQLLQDNLVKIYVLDCRKPIHLANIYSSKKIVIFSDSMQDGDEMPSDGDNLSGGDESSSSSSSSDSGSDEDSDDEDLEKEDDNDEDDVEANFENIVTGSGLRKENPEISAIPASSKNTMDIYENDASYEGEDEKESNDSDDEPAHDNDDNDNDNAMLNGDGSAIREPKRRKMNTNQEQDRDGDNQHYASVQGDDKFGDEMPQQTENSPRELHSKRLDRLRQYYNDGSFYGSPAAFVAYKLASQFRYGEKGDLLWLACVGVTDAYLHARLDKLGYAKMAKELSDLCVKFFPNNMYERALNTVYAEDLIGKHSNGRGNSNQTKTKLALSENGRIFSEKDFRFFMLRHSSLLDSMKYSEYVWTRLKVYTKEGEQQLLEMLAKMGYPLEECRQPFPFMKPALRRRLKEKLSTHAQEYNLDHFEFTSFARITGYQSMLSASDTSYAVTALLEYETANDISSASNNTTNSIDQDYKVGAEAFNNAYDALGTNSSEPMEGLLDGMNNEGYDASNLVNGGNLSTNIGIGAGLRRAMVLQKSILHTAVGLSERGAIACLQHFRYAHVTSSTHGKHQVVGTDLIQSASNDTGNDKRDLIFSKPLALTRLAHFLMDMNRENGKWTGTKARPLVLIANKPRSNTCLIVGYEYPERAGDFVRNKFGQYFKQTAESMNGTFKFDSFDSNVVEVGAGEVQRFMEQLYYLLNSSL